MAATDCAEVVKIVRDHGEFSATKCGSSVVHQRTVVIRLSKGGNASALLEVMPLLRGDIVKDNFEMLVSVSPALFVVKANSMTKLVSNNTLKQASIGLE